MKQNLQKRFLLVDECDRTFTDLIEFKKPIDLNMVIQEIEKVKQEKRDSYTNEDIYNAIDKVSDDYTITFLGDYTEIYY